MRKLKIVLNSILLIITVPLFAISVFAKFVIHLIFGVSTRTHIDYTIGLYKNSIESTLQEFPYEVNDIVEFISGPVHDVNSRELLTVKDAHEFYGHCSTSTKHFKTCFLYNKNTQKVHQVALVSLRPKKPAKTK